MKLSMEYDVRVACEALDLAPSSYYYRPRASDETAVQGAMRAIAGEWPTYGYRRMTAELGRRGLRVNGKRVRRLMDELDMKRPQPKRRRRTTNSEHSFPRYPNLVEDLKVTAPDQVWVADITYIRLEREFVYLAILMDVYTRSIRGWSLRRSLDQDLTLMALKAALRKGTPGIHHSDQGVQYAATAYVECLEEAGTRISMADLGVPEQNGYAERLIRTIKEEEVDLAEYEDYEDAKEQIGQFIEEVYMKKRIHSALGYLPPAEYEEEWKKSCIGGSQVMRSFKRGGPLHAPE